MKRALLLALVACGSHDLPTSDATEATATSALLATGKLAELSAVKTNPDSAPRGFTTLGTNVLYFNQIRKGMWRTDGTPAGTTILRDIEPTIDSYQETPHIVTLGTKAYWTQGNALWSTDGTPESITQVSTFPTTATLTASVVYNNAIYFGTATQLYKSDGTTAGTQPLATAQVFSSNAYFSMGFHVMGGNLYFPCEIAGSGSELCVTDGTAAGTKVVKDIRPGAASSSPHLLGSVGNKLLFSAQMANPLNLNALWASDGTDAGTIQLIAPATNSDVIGTYEENFAVLGANAFVPCYTSATGFELCKTNGTVAGTSVIDVVPGTTSGSPSALAVLGTKLFFTATTAAAGRELWSSTGTVAGTALFADLLPGQFDGASYGTKLVIGNTLYFPAHASLQDSVELWKSDGTVAGTMQVKDILPAGMPERYGIVLGAALGTKLVFAADDGVHGLEPWVTDGTDAGTVLLKDMLPPTSAAEVYEARALDVGSFLAVHDTPGTNVWKSDGTAAGTGLFQTFNQQGVFGFTRLGQRMLYAASTTGVNGLWTSDGTQPGTTKLLDLPGSVQEFAANTSRVAFTGSTPNQTMGLWTSDGTAAGTHLTAPQIDNARRLGVGNDKFWLTGLYGAAGNELWTTDGTTASAVKDIRTGSGSSEPSNFAGLPGGITVFAANDGVVGSELWRTDGTAAGTTRIADLRAGATGSGPFGMFAWHNMVLFWAASSTASYELWKTDGTAAGTTLVKAISYGGAGAFVAWGNYVLFAAVDAQGEELWRTDGTPAGTVQVADLYVGPASAAPANLTLVGPNGPLVFSAEEPRYGRELWQLDDPVGVPALAADIVPGPQSSRPGFITVNHNAVVFVADDGAGAAAYGIPIMHAPVDGAPDAGPGNGPDASPSADAGTENPAGGEASGCGCASHSPGGAWPLILVVLALRRQRRTQSVRRRS